MKNILIIFILFLFFPLHVFSQKQDESLVKNPPKLTEFVTDETGALSKSQLDYLRLKLYYFFDSTSTQIVVYMISTLNGEPIEEVANAIAMKNKIGKKDNNNGVLLLIAKNDHKLRIEVGYGLEGVLTDALSSQIIKKEIAPHFKEGDFYEGISKGIDAIISAARGEYTDKSNYNSASTFKAILTVILVFIGVIGGIGIFWWIVSLISVKTGYVGGTRSRGSSYYSSGSSSGGYSSSGSGFSGGGGSFGGGGASGSW
ncbi:MAG: TPM domain-containing protein [Ignavibacteriae bacterium]|nr:TPM domain-containing protein [Ignavibacteriota bacterium]